MNNLFQANLMRIRKSILFWGMLVVTLAASVAYMLNGYRQAAVMQSRGYVDYGYIDKYFFNLAPALGILFAVYISLFLVTEYRDGTIRNKIISGHTRVHIYLANLFVSIIVALVYTAVWIAGGMVGMFFLPEWQLPVTWILLYFLICMLASMALAAIFTLMGMLFSYGTTGSVMTLLLFLALLVFASYLYNKLEVPEESSGIVITTEGMQMLDPEPNPDYVSEPLRSVYEVVLRVLPTGQTILMANLEITEPILPIVSSVLVTIFISAGGIALFKKKDLK